MKWSRRKYTLNGKRIDSSRVNGIVHTRRRNIETSCMGCDEPIIKGQKYVQLLIYGADPIHLDCYHRPCILGVKTIPTKYGPYGMRGLPGEVICEEFE